MPDEYDENTPKELAESRNSETATFSLTLNTLLAHPLFASQKCAGAFVGGILSPVQPVQTAATDRENFSSKFLGRAHTRGDCCYCLVDDILKKFPWGSY
jgi:hypothetical protein